MNTNTYGFCALTAVTKKDYGKSNFRRRIAFYMYTYMCTYVELFVKAPYVSVRVDKATRSQNDSRLIKRSE